LVNRKFSRATPSKQNLRELSVCTLRRLRVNHLRTRKAAERNEVARVEPKDSAAKVLYERFTACEEELVRETKERERERKGEREREDKE